MNNEAISFFPAAGFLNNTGSVNNQGTNGYYWASAANGTNARYVNFNSATVSVSNNNRVNGMPVRCVQAFTASFFFFFLPLILFMQLLEDLFDAYYQARKGKRNSGSQLQFEMNLEENLVKLYHEIKQQTYTVGKSLCFIINKPVKREIFAAGFRDRIVHHLLFNYMNPLIERTLIADCYSCRKGKGTLYGIERLKKHIKQCSQNYTQDCYVLKLDIQGYFMNISRDKLQVQVDSIIDQYGYLRDENGIRFEDSYRAKLVNYLLPIVINNNPTSGCIIKSSSEEWDTLPKDKSLFYSPINVGLPIGNLTSQLFSNVYLNKLDQFVKRELKIKHYGRYVDDFFLIHRSKEYLKKVVGILKEFLSAKLGLTIHPRKIVLQHYKKGIAFLGAIVKPYRVYVNHRIAVNFKNSCLQCEQRLIRVLEDVPSRAMSHDLRVALNSHLGLLRHFSTYRLKSKTLQKMHKIYQYGYFGTHYNLYVLSKPSTSAHGF